MSRAMGSMIRRATVLIVYAMMLANCGSDSGARFPPTTPSPPPTTGPAANGPYTLSGAVTAAGRPLVGARVAVLELETALSATTDDKGLYTIPGLPASSFWGRTLVRFSQPGYFTEFKRPNILAHTRLDVALDPLAFIAIGDPVRGTVRAGDAMCAGKDYEEGACQRFAVIAPVAGTLQVILSSPSVSLDVVNPEGEAFAAFNGSPKRVNIPAQAGGTYEVRVLSDILGAADFELLVTTIAPDARR